MDDSAGNKSQILIAANPKSGAHSSRSRVSALRDCLLSNHFDVEVCDTLELLAYRSQQLSDAGSLRAVIAAGGDGTVAAVTNLIPQDIPIAVFPLGTENLLAKYFGLTSDITALLQSLRQGTVLRVDVGRANGRLFLVMLGCGFDAEVVRRLHQHRQGHIRRMSYAKPIFDAVRTYQYPQIEIEVLEHQSAGSVQISGEIASGVEATSDFLPGQKAGADRAIAPAAWLFAFNLPKYAANLQFCPQATERDGLIDVCPFRRGGLWHSAWYLTKVWRGKHQMLNEFRHFRASRFRLTSRSTVPYQLDGDPGGVLPLEVETLRERLPLLIPRGTTNTGASTVETIAGA